MRREDISGGISGISSRYIQEAAEYEEAERRGALRRRTVRAAAAVAALCLLAGGFAWRASSGGVVTAYARGTDEELTAAGAAIHTGTISDTGEMRGHPLMFYLSSRDIGTVRFSCKNQWISFMDWTEERRDVGRSRSFTVSYGEDARTYRSLLIDWEPEATIRALTDTGAAIADLPKELREDVIVLEITFLDGSTATKAVTVSLLDDGTFFAAFGDYVITEADDFIGGTEDEAGPQEPSEHRENGQAVSGAEEAARAYYAGTVFRVVSMEVTAQTDNEVTFSVSVEKGGIRQEPDRGITLQLMDDVWQVVNEGY